MASFHHLRSQNVALWIEVYYTMQTSEVIIITISLVKYITKQWTPDLVEYIIHCEP